MWIDNMWWQSTSQDDKGQLVSGKSYLSNQSKHMFFRSNEKKGWDGEEETHLALMSACHRIQSWGPTEWERSWEATWCHFSGAKRKLLTSPQPPTDGGRKKGKRQSQKSQILPTASQHTTQSARSTDGCKLCLAPKWTLMYIYESVTVDVLIIWYDAGFVSGIWINQNVPH